MKWCFVPLLLAAIIFISCHTEPEPIYDGKPLSEWVVALKDNSFDRQEKAVKALVAIGNHSVPALIDVLKHDKDRYVRMRAAHVISKIGDDTHNAVPALLEVIKNEKEDMELLQSLAEALDRLSSDMEGILPTLIDLIQHGTPFQMLIAAERIEALDSKGKKAAAIPVAKGLQSLIQNNYLDIADDIFFTLEKMGSEAEDAIPIIVDFLNHESPEIRTRTLSSLGKIGAQNDQAFRAITKCMNDGSPKVRALVIQIVTNIAPKREDVIHILASALNDQDPHIRSKAANVIGGMGAVSKKAVPALMEALEDEEMSVRRSVIRALGDLGSDAKEALPALKQAMNKEQEQDLVNEYETAIMLINSSATVATIETDFGKILIKFYAKEAPQHMANFIKLAKEGFYDGCTFHRVIPNFVIQGGDPLSRDDNPSNDGVGGPGYTIPAEIGVKHTRGAVAAARKGDQINPEKRSNGSQFYICVKDLPNLDSGGYSVFGQVIQGMDVVDSIVSVDRDRRDNPLQKVVMKKVYISSE